MADPETIDVFVRCPACGNVDRLVSTPISESQLVSCSQCGAPMGEWGKLKLMARRGDNGAPQGERGGLRSSARAKYPDPMG